MADQMSDADKIRAKRLAKLQGAGQSASQSSPPPNENTVGPSGALAQTIQNEQQVQSKEQANPFRQIVPDSSPAAPKINITPAATQSSSGNIPRKRSRSGQRASSPGPADGQSLSVWQDKFLRSTFRFTFDPDQTQDHHGNRLNYIRGVREELEESGLPRMMSPELLDTAIIEIGSNLDPKLTPVNYLIPCWRSLSQAWNRTWKSKPSDPRREVVETARRLCLSYCIYAISMPDMFGRQATGSNLLAEHLLLDQENSQGLDHDFLTELAILVPEMEEAREVFAGAMDEISSGLARMTMDGDYRPAMNALRIVSRYPVFVDVMAESSRFLPDGVTAANLEVKTFLGPFFQISPLQADVTATYFSSPQTRDRGFIATTQEALRMTLRTHQTDLAQIVDRFIKRSPQIRNKTLDWFARTVNLNHKRRALHVDQKLVSSDGFMVNVTYCLDTLCEPFMDAQFSKLEKIDPDYLRREPRVDVSDETKTNADQKASDSFYAREAAGQSNFISEVFFLTVAAHHYGTEAAGSTLERLEKDLKHMEKQIKQLENDRMKIAATRAAQLPLYDRALSKYKDQLDKGLAYKYAIQAILLDRQAQTRSMQFMRYVIVWMLHLVSPGRSYPKQRLQLPLPKDQPEVFACLPEYFVDDVVSNFKFIVRNMPDILTSTQSEEIVMLCITFLRSSEYIKNPYLKAGLVTILFAGTWPAYNRSKGVLSDLLNSMPFCTEHLLHSLMKFYIEVEDTGAHTQFYDKFNIRFEIFQIIKNIWGTRMYKDNLEAEAKVNRAFFVKFVNLLLNDVTFVLDEALSNLNKIHEIQELLRSPHGQSLEAEARQEKESALSDAQGKAKSYMQLTNETMEMLRLFTETLPESFTVPEIVQRLTDMLDHNLANMVGPKMGQLKVQNPQEYNFNAKALLKDIVSVYLNLRSMDSLAIAIARDGRSYSDTNFREAARVLTKHVLLAPKEVASFLALADDAKAAKEVEDQAEVDLGEIPDEFLDPLLFTLMEDPVILPTSKTTVDRSTIVSHLLSDSKDPFNRAPLKIEDVVPDLQRKAQIEAFKKAARSGVAAADVMDTS